MIFIVFFTALASGQPPKIKGQGPTNIEQASKGGVVTEGFQLFIQPEKDVVRGEEPIQLKLQLKNTTEKVLLVKEIAAWYDYVLNVRTESGQNVPFTELGQKIDMMLRGTGDKVRRSIRNEPSTIYTWLKPGEELTDSIDVTELYKITTEGTYFITVKRSVYSLDGKSLAEVISNTIRVEVVH